MPRRETGADQAPARTMHTEPNPASVAGIMPGEATRAAPTKGDPQSFTRKPVEEEKVKPGSQSTEHICRPAGGSER